MRYSCLIVFVALLFGCFSLRVTVGGEDTAVYPLWYPPVLAVHADTPETLAALAKSNLLQTWRGLSNGSGMLGMVGNLTKHSPQKVWRQMPLLGRIPGTIFIDCLTRAQAADLTFMVLPGKTPTVLRLLFSVRLPKGTGAKKRAAFIAGLGAEFSKITHSQWDGTTVYFSSLYDLNPKGKARLRSDPQLFADWHNPHNASSHPTADLWRPSLAQALHSPADTLTVWVHPARPLAYIASRYRFFVQESFRNANWRLPSAFVLNLQAVRGEMKTTLSLPLPAIPSAAKGDFSLPVKRTVPAEKSASFPSLRAAFPARPLIFAEANLSALPKISGQAQSPWTLCLECLAADDPGTRDNIAKLLYALRTLTGLHPQTHFFDYLQPGYAVAVWDEKPGKRRWAFVAGRKAVTANKNTLPLRTHLSRLTLWLESISKTQGWRLAVRPPASAAGGLPWKTAIYKIGKDAPLAAILLTDNFFAVADSQDTASAALVRLRAASPPTTQTPAPLLSWQFDFVGHKADAASFFGSYAWFADYLQAEKGRLQYLPNEVQLEFSGSYAPLATTAFLLTNESLLAAAFPADKTAAAVGLLRLFLTAQQVYRHLNLGQFNQRTGQYAASILQLLDDRDANGEPLAAMYSRLYDPPEKQRTEESIPFPVLVRYVAEISAKVGDNRYWQGYKFMPPLSVAGKRLDYHHDWALLAIPRLGAKPNLYPALVIYADGSLYRNRRRIRTAADAAEIRRLPAHPGAKGWEKVY